MTDLMAVDNGFRERFEEYEELLCKRDQLNKEAASILIAYTKEFGDMITGNFELKIDCIKKKKMIAFCQKQINCGKGIDADLMNTLIEQEMKIYYHELQDMLIKNKLAKDAKNVSEFRVQRAKKIYRRLAKMLHPDINGKTAENMELMELWDRISYAYQISDVDDLEDLEILVRKALEELGEDSFEIAYTDIEDRIERITRQINEILTTEPYIYMDLLCNEEKKAEKKKELEAEREEYQQYLKELTETLDKMIQEGGVKITWEMN